MATVKDGREMYSADDYGAWPKDEFKLDVGDGHQLNVWVYGNPEGQPVVYNHGGPGGGSKPTSHQFFKPDKYRVVVYDQRGCGKSVPNAANDLKASLHMNDTSHLVQDLERIRTHLKFDKWHVFGGSWGSTLSIAYAEAHPDNVLSLTVFGIFLFSEREMWSLFLEGGAQHYPQEFRRFEAHIRNNTHLPPLIRDGDLIAAYFDILTSETVPKEAQREAAKEFVRYELSISKVFKDQDRIDNFLADAEKFVPFATFEAHYFVHSGFLRRGQLLSAAPRLKDVRVNIIHGRCDVVCRPQAAFELYQAVGGDENKNASLVFVDGNGHSDTEPSIIHHLVQTMDSA